MHDYIHHYILYIVRKNGISCRMFSKNEYKLENSKLRAVPLRGQSGEHVRPGARFFKPLRQCTTLDWMVETHPKIMWLKQQMNHPWLGMLNIPPIKMVMTGGWFMIVLPTLMIIMGYTRIYQLSTGAGVRNHPRCRFFFAQELVLLHGFSWPLDGQSMGNHGAIVTPKKIEVRKFPLQNNNKLH